MGPAPHQPARRRRGRRAPRLLIGLLVSAGFHGAAVLVLVQLSALGLLWDPPRPPSMTAPAQAVGLRDISAEDWAKHRGEPPKERGATDPRSVAKRPEPKKKAPEERPDGQVVATAPGNGETDPDSNYLSETSNRTEKETRAKEQTPFYRNPMPQATTTTPQAPADAAPESAPDGSGNHGAGEDDRPAEAAQRRMVVEVPDSKARDEVKLDAPHTGGDGPLVANRSESLAIRGNSERLRLVPGVPDDAGGSLGRAGRPGQVNLMPSLTVLDSVVGGAPNDHLDVEVGDGTYLNTREWKYASFFNRVKQSIGMAWNPGPELHRRDPSGTMYGRRDRHTVLAVTLTEQGLVREVYVVKSSGLDFLDLEAIRSFERAQPFPNPPQGLVGKDATVSFQFGFFVQLDSPGGAFRSYRRR